MEFHNIVREMCELGYECRVSSTGRGKEVQVVFYHQGTNTFGQCCGLYIRDVAVQARSMAEAVKSTVKKNDGVF